MKEICICILAHNEERNIHDTIISIDESCGETPRRITVYANGCTDKTEEIVLGIRKQKEYVFLKSIFEPSKINAWNTAFHDNDNDNDILIYADGDIIPDKSSVKYLYDFLISDETGIALAGCNLKPLSRNINMSNKIVGFMQIPLVNDFLSGALYAIKKDYIKKKFDNLHINGIPSGVVAEDTFLQLLVNKDRFRNLEIDVYYYPPNFDEYCKYSARIKWQNDQLWSCYNHLFSEKNDHKINLFQKYERKFQNLRLKKISAKSIVAFSLKSIVNIIFFNKINSYYKNLGPITKYGEHILSKDTRSISSK